MPLVGALFVAGPVRCAMKDKANNSAPGCCGRGHDTSCH